MKKAVLIFAVILSVSLFAGCGSQKEPAADPAVMEASGEEEEEKTMTGTLDEIKNFMFVLKEGEDTYYAFAFDEKPEGLDSLKTGDKVTVTYTGEVSEIDAFIGKIISIEKAE